MLARYFMIDTIIIASSYCIVVEKATLESLQALTKSCFQKAAIYALFRYNSSLKRSVTSSVTTDIEYYSLGTQ